MHLITHPSIDSDDSLDLFLPYQLKWIEDDSPLRLAEKSVRIGWTFCDAFKNVRKRLRYKNRDYLFATKDFDSAVEYINVCQKVAELFNLPRFILSHGEQFHKVPRLDEHGHPSAFTDEIKMG